MNQNNNNNLYVKAMTQAFRGLTPRRTKVIIAIGAVWASVAVLFQLVFVTLILPNLTHPIVVTLSGPKNPMSGSEIYTDESLIFMGWMFVVAAVIFGILLAIGVAIKKPALWVTGALFSYLIGAFFVGRYLGVSLNNWWGLGESLVQVITTVLLLGITFHVYLWAVQRDIKDNTLLK